MRRSRMVAVAALWLGLTAASAQGDELTGRKLEVGGHYTLFHFEGDGTNHGFGAWVAYMLDPSIGFEAEVAWLPADQGDLTQMFFGAKLGDRRGRIGSYLKARPGVVRLEVPLACAAIFPPPPGCDLDAVRGESHFAFDFGGIFEYHATDQMFLRIDAGNTFVHVRDFWTNNFQFAAGVGVRF